LSIHTDGLISLVLPLISILDFVARAMHGPNNINGMFWG